MIRWVERIQREGSRFWEYTYDIVRVPKHFNVGQLSKAPAPQYMFEHHSHTNKNIMHTTIYWNNNEISCSCPGDEFHNRCRERVGMRLMVDGTISPGDFDYIRKIMKEGPRKEPAPEEVPKTIDDWDPDEAINNME